MFFFSFFSTSTSLSLYNAKKIQGFNPYQISINQTELDQQFLSIMSKYPELSKFARTPSSPKDKRFNGDRSICLYNTDQTKCGSNPRPIQFSQLTQKMNYTEFIELNSIYIAESLTFDFNSMFGDSFNSFRLLQNTIDIDTSFFSSSQIYSFSDDAKLTIKINKKMQLLFLVCDPNFVSVEVLNNPDIQLSLTISEWLVPTFANSVTLGDLSIFRVVGINPSIQKEYNFGNIQSPNFEYVIFNEVNSSDHLPISVEARKSVQIGQVTLPASYNNVDFILNHNQVIKMSQSGLESGLRVGVFTNGGARIIFDDTWNSLTDGVFDLDETDKLPATFYTSLENLPFFLNEPQINFDIKPSISIQSGKPIGQQELSSSAPPNENHAYKSWIYVCAFGFVSVFVITGVISLKAKRPTTKSSLQNQL